MAETHRDRVLMLLGRGAAAHAELIAQVRPEMRASLPVDAQGVTQAIGHLAAAAGLSEQEQQALIRPHAVNPAVMHARVYGRAP
jgi:hypothetical protein